MSRNQQLSSKVAKAGNESEQASVNSRSPKRPAVQTVGDDFCFDDDDDGVDPPITDVGGSTLMG